MIYHGIALMVCAGLGLTGVLYQLHHLAIEGYHSALWANHLERPRSAAERRHLRRPCSECSMIAELATTRLTTVQ